MTPTADDFHALARSSPWRWSTLHFRHVSHHDRAGRSAVVEAWMARPERLLVRDDRGTARHDGWPYGSTHSEYRWPADVEPERRPDGLVLTRPDDWLIRWGDPLYGDYQWVALLDPVELSHHVEVTDVRVGERFGRPTWESRASARDGYDPRCSCCPLLWSEIADRYEYDDDWTPPPGRSYPTAYDVAIDFETSVVVRSESIGGDHAGLDFEVEILEVDTDLDAVLG